jgi:hypothetical protein
MTVLIWPGPKPLTTEERDTARYGAKINRHVDGVTSRVLDRTPTVADAGTGREPVKAVPIEKYARDGQVLTLVVLHSALCEPVEVLLALAGTSLEVVVFVAPYEIYASSPPSDPPSCRIADRSDPFAWHTALDVVLPAGLTASAVRDVGAGGPALAVSPPG